MLPEDFNIFFLSRRDSTSKMLIVSLRYELVKPYIRGLIAQLWHSTWMTYEEVL